MSSGLAPGWRAELIEVWFGQLSASPLGRPDKPPHLFARDAEWAALAGFAADARPGATLGVVSGRRRQGKSYLLQALATARGGIYFPALELTETVSLRLFADELIRFSGAPVPPFRDWLDAIPYLFRLAEDHVVPVIIDEFPYLVRASPGLPSIIQRELGPGGSGSASRVRLLLCGSAMSVMGGLLSGPAPLRGRAGLELAVHPFGYRDAARFREITDPKLAVLVHSVVGGTPAYRRELLREDTPADIADFDAWVIRTVLNPQTPLFREARYLLAEETEIRDPSLYHSVLAAVAEGNNTTGGIASYIGRARAPAQGSVPGRGEVGPGHEPRPGRTPETCPGPARGQGIRHPGHRAYLLLRCRLRP